MGSYREVARDLSFVWLSQILAQSRRRSTMSKVMLSIATQL